MSECLTKFDAGAQTVEESDFAFCTMLQDFGACLALAPPGSNLERSANQLLLEAKQASNQHCLVKETPSNPTMEVIDRQLRFTAENDVLFRRYRGEQVSVFDIKEQFDIVKDQKADITMVDAAVEALKEEVAQSKLDAAQDKLNATAALKNVENALDTKLADLKTGELTDLTVKIKTVEGAAADLDSKIAAVKAEVIAASNAAFWLHTTPAAFPTNTVAGTVNLAGFGLEQYYNAFYKSLFSCTFTPETGDAIVTKGKVIKDSDANHAIACVGPNMITKKTVFTVSVTWNTKSGKMEIPFTGSSGDNTVQFSMTYSKITVVNAELIVDVAGLDEAGKYICEFADQNSGTKKASAGAFIDGTFGGKISCGKVPTGFTINGIESTVKFAMKLADTNNYLLNAGDESDVLTINTCTNGVKDGKETDLDCGGPCATAGFQCAVSKVCELAADCANNLQCHNKKCGADGLSKATAGKTCKSIKLQHPNTKNGVYWVVGPKDEFKSNPKQVFCWQADREGGGWTLGKKTWHGQHHSLPRGGRGATGNVQTDPLANRGKYYTLDDQDIRTYIGQPNPTDDSTGAAASSFSYMVDQSYRNTYYSNVNREYIVGKSYTARWFFQHWTPVAESTTNHEFTSWLLAKNSNGVTPGGDGQVNWRGRPRCGPSRAGGMGIVCNSPHSGSPTGNPLGGRGCKTDVSNRRWHHNLNFKMMETNWDTYNYVCNGAQHSSSNQFANRIWFRSPDSQKDW